MYNLFINLKYDSTCRNAWVKVLYSIINMPSSYKSFLISHNVPYTPTYI